MRAARRILDKVQRGIHYRMRFGLRHTVAYVCRPWLWLPAMTSARRPLQAQRSAPRDASLPFGVNLTGHVTAASGLGEAARLMAEALEAAGVPVALNEPWPEDPGTRQAERLAVSVDNPYRFNLVFMGLDNVVDFARRRGEQYFAGRFTIASFPWENVPFPREYASVFRFFDEVWVPGSLGIEGLRALAGDVPVVRVPHPIRVRPEYDGPRSRFLDGIAAESFVFLFVFDFRSVFERKNPLALVRAFRTAFEDEAGAALVLKSVGGAGTRELAALEAAAKGANIRVIDKAATRDEVDELTASCDCYVSLHRAEGFGLTMAEAMAFGKPVIATGYGGNADFMTAANSYLVEYDLTTTDRRVGPYDKGWTRAEPNVEHAASLMRRVFESREEARAVGQRGREDVRRLLAPKVVGEQMRQRLVAMSRASGLSQ